MSEHQIKTCEREVVTLAMGSATSRHQVGFECSCGTTLYQFHWTREDAESVGRMHSVDEWHLIGRVCDQIDRANPDPAHRGMPDHRPRHHPTREGVQLAMGFWFKSNPTPPADVSAHEAAHARACRGEGIAYRWVNRKGEQVVEGEQGSGRGAAIALYAGAIAGGGDANGDRKAALMLAKEAGISEDDLKRAARKYT